MFLINYPFALPFLFLNAIWLVIRRFYLYVTYFFVKNKYDRCKAMIESIGEPLLCINNRTVPYCILEDVIVNYIQGNVSLKDLLSELPQVNNTTITIAIEITCYEMTSLSRSYRSLVQTHHKMLSEGNFDMEALQPYIAEVATIKPERTRCEKLFRELFMYTLERVIPDKVLSEESKNQTLQSYYHYYQIFEEENTLNVQVAETVSLAIIQDIWKTQSNEYEQ